MSRRLGSAPALADRAPATVEVQARARRAIDEHCGVKRFGYDSQSMAQSTAQALDAEIRQGDLRRARMADRVYHRTPAADAIVRDGFRDATGTYMTGGRDSQAYGPRSKRPGTSSSAESQATRACS